ncbi:urea carboxylase [Thioalbus denitrificans]|uniref:Biotin carboxylase n=1 Tax=Thioalbus denitrificans TaxID=547122 RepID=A0A369BT13_9GAMM|nr:urea carboxylase [Thioalbus denitrificans]RCX24779.1 urea carboxylase [Thioalbus denitrificans]
MFKKVLIANRGAIACRVIRTLKRMGIKSVAVYSEADAHSLHVAQADEALCIGPAPASRSYLDTARILAAARESGAQAIHPGYGFLSENAAFAELCAAEGIAFIGPTPQQMRDFGLKHTARELAQINGVPLLPGSGLLEGVEYALAEAARIGYPVMLKSTAGGGGIGMQLCRDEAELREAYHSVERLSRNNFGQVGMFLEKFIERARHIEVQIFGDGAGRVVALGERDCSVQRRNQKVIEETPAPGLDDALRARLHAAAVRLGRAVGYRSAGTVEFIFDADTDDFHFLEVNTRLQVEHGVTEEVYGVDLVEWMVRQAAGESEFLDSYRPNPRGWAIQARLYAEDPARNFQPSAGLLTEADFAGTARVETWVERGSEVPPHYDPMIAKIICAGADRAEALANLSRALAATRVAGIETNLDYLRQVVAHDTFRRGRQITAFLGGFHYAPATVEVLVPGTQTTVQDWPGRVGHWDVGVPPSGPMDHLAFRLANRIVGNAEGAPGLELTVSGPTLRFNTGAVIALTGADMQAELNGGPVPRWAPVTVPAGATLRLKAAAGPGTRAYLAVRGGFDVPDYLGSRATFTLGQFGGHAGRTLRVGDVLHLGGSEPEAAPAALPPALVPEYTTEWEVGVLYGPHGAPDFFTDEDIGMFFGTAWEVHYNSSRTGVRLIGPKPKWARSDGGEAGLHPSNIHDNAYAIGSVDFTGDMPVILGPDGPSLGGFVCPATIVQAELWKLGQLKPGDTVRFRPLTLAEASHREAVQAREVAALSQAPERPAPIRREGGPAAPAEGPVLARLPATAERVEVTYRQAGDRYLLVEYGPLVLDLELRFRAHALMAWLKDRNVPGIVDLTPGIRSLQVHYDSRVLATGELLETLVAAEAELPPLDELEVPSRIVHLPLSWDDPATRLAIDKYMQSVRPNAPWCPSNIEFIRRINGLDSIDQVREILFNASYLVLGLGDVYLGAPVATPLDPRHRLVTTKYNPARTWTPENAVGIGGAYLCVYGMEGPGGYQFVGRTVQMWNRYRQTADFTGGKPWLLRFFDQIRFYPVGGEELLRMREEFIQGRFRLKVEETTFSLRDYRAFLAGNSESIAAFKSRQQAAFDAERERWERDGQSTWEQEADAAPVEEGELPPGCHPIASHVPGSVWQIPVQAGQRVHAGQELVIVESMKMEIAILAAEDGVVESVLCREGGQVAAGQNLVIIRGATAATA